MPQLIQVKDQYCDCRADINYIVYSFECDCFSGLWIYELKLVTALNYTLELDLNPKSLLGDHNPTLPPPPLRLIASNI